MTHVAPSRLRRRLVLLGISALTLVAMIVHPATARASDPQCQTGCIWWENNVCLQEQTCCLDDIGWYCVTN